MRHHFSLFIASLGDLLFPRLCPICGKRLMRTEQVLCATCLVGLPLVAFPNSQDNALIRKLWAFVPVEHAYAWIYYHRASVYSRAFMQFKYNKHPTLALDLAKMAARSCSLDEMVAEVDAIIPVPMARRKRISRIYNQTEWIAKGLSSEWELPVYTTILKYTKVRSSQKQLTGEERRKNVHNLYKASIPESLKGKHFLLVDDICTTGSTLIACAEAIIKADKSAKISVFTLGLVRYS